MSLCFEDAQFLRMRHTVARETWGLKNPGGCQVPAGRRECGEAG
jgi:hypothetical protein